MVATLGLSEPSRCLDGCEQDEDDENPTALSPVERSLADLWVEHNEPIVMSESVHRKLPREPEDLFKPDMGRPPNDDEPGPQFDDVPSPDALFHGLSPSSPKSKG